MKQEPDLQELNSCQIRLHLKSAVDALTPNVFDRIDLTVPQEAAPIWQEVAGAGNRIAPGRHRHGMALAAAACLCVVLTGGGVIRYQYQNQKIDTVIGIDVNPSVELSINRRNRILEAEALNTDAVEILDGMELKGVELNVAVNAVIGSMVTHGYLDDLDNAILVTVSNDSVSKASQLRASVVSDIEQTLEENQVQAVVYDQQVIEKNEMKELAEQYGISYGKAYFIKELIDENAQLTMEDMEELSTMTMEQIAERITNSALALGEFADRVAETTAAPETTAETRESETPEETAQTEPESATEPSVETTAQTTEPETTTAPQTTEEETEAVEDNLVEIDYVDYEDGMVYVYFATYVKWKNPTVSVRDEEGNSYAAYVEDTHSDECLISVQGLEGGKSYTFVLGGLMPKGGNRATTVKGYFDKPFLAGEEDDEEETREQETVKESQGSTDAESSGGEPETSAPEETSADTGSSAETDAGHETESAGESSSATPEHDEKENPEEPGSLDEDGTPAGSPGAGEESAGEETIGKETTGS